MQKKRMGQEGSPHSHVNKEIYTQIFYCFVKSIIKLSTTMKNNTL